MKTIEAYGYYFDEPNAPLRRGTFQIESIPAGEVVVEVAGCGLCHTDITFYTGEVKAKRMPVILGHEISGVVVEADDACRDLVGQAVIVPAILPCGECEMCRKGRSNVCPAQKFPGNDFDGGFASHLVVPGRFLCPVPKDTGEVDLASLAVIADAVTTPYQALVRSGLADGDLAIVSGVGGLGTYMVQLAHAHGATVIALDVDDAKLERALSMGAHKHLNVGGMAEGEVKKAVREIVKADKLPRGGWKVFETSGTAPGQRNAFALLTHAGTLGIVGFTMEKVEVRLSNVMAFDADIFGNWGCKPEYYPEVVDAVVSGRINVRDNVEHRPLDSINEVFELAMGHQLERRVVFEP